MTTEQKIEAARKRIEELERLIKSWSKKQIWEFVLIKTNMVGISPSTINNLG